MTAKIRDDIALPLAGEPGASQQPRTPIAAFVPITVALVGVGLILFGGLTAHDGTTVAGATGVAVDPVVTGSVAPERDHRYDLMMLDR